MTNYKLSAYHKERRGSDSETNLTLSVVRNYAPQRLSDFNGGTAELFDGYSTYTFRFNITLNTSDNRKITLIPSDEYKGKLELCPEFTRSIDQQTRQPILLEVPLKLNQDINEFVINLSNWGLL